MRGFGRFGRFFGFCVRTLFISTTGMFSVTNCGGMFLTAGSGDLYVFNCGGMFLTAPNVFNCGGMFSVVNCGHRLRAGSADPYNCGGCF